ncbi:protein NO VEIN domain-containing protein [Sorangium sp. So ce1128]
MRHYMQYHNTERMGYGCAEISTGPIGIVTQKRIPDVLGDVVWIICGEGKPRRYGLCARFIAEEIDSEDEDPETTVSGEGTLFTPDIPLSDEPWFKSFLANYQNFSLGFREIKEEEYIDRLEALARSRLRAGAGAEPAAPRRAARKASESGGGFGEPEVNVEVERRAVWYATELYQKDGWKVVDVSKEKRGYDLKCSRRRAEEHVEVKGVRGDRESFMITRGEVEQARGDSAFVLVLVTGALSERPVVRRYSGREMLDKFDLQPLAFQANVRRL